MNPGGNRLENTEKGNAFSILQEELGRVGYPARYVQAPWGGSVPCGMSGEELLRLYERIQPRYLAHGMNQR